AYRISKVVSEDFEGSPYAIPSYQFNLSLGGQRGFQSLVKRAHKAGLTVIVDFVSNHMAMDSPWIKEEPRLFVRSDTRARNQLTSEFFLHPTGELIAFGRDPYFPPWNDTAQLDYTNPALRARMIETLKWISRYADGVRCDMAMLVLRDYIRHQWYPLASDSWFNERMPGEFWDEAIRETKKIRPDFKFIAETYWDKEERLYELGFDLCYEKKLYDALVARNAQMVTDRLARERLALDSSLYFIENHDEPRAASVFNRTNNLAAAALILSLPGTALIHEGQMEGKREKLPVQRIKPLLDEPADAELREAYSKILGVTSEDVFKDGSFTLFESNVYGVVAFIRQGAGRTVAYLGQISEAWHKFNSFPVDVTPLARAIGAQSRFRLTNLLTSSSVTVEENGGAYRLQLNELAVGGDANFCLLEARK
ncbi:MAG TPA: alpha-amylase family glycosyl hydrolase, partial [Blastocatellia bacterium]|nr:alpha-amylase family glycosyl hydrolase [Blastocatellia bacterium]